MTFAPSEAMASAWAPDALGGARNQSGLFPSVYCIGFTNEAFALETDSKCTQRLVIASPRIEARSRHHAVVNHTL